MPEINGSFGEGGRPAYVVSELVPGVTVVIPSLDSGSATLFTLTDRAHPGAVPIYIDGHLPSASVPPPELLGRTGEDDDDDDFMTVLS